MRKYYSLCRNAKSVVIITHAHRSIGLKSNLVRKTEYKFKGYQTQYYYF